jgi:hypothetical protein
MSRLLSARLWFKYGIEGEESKWRKLAGVAGADVRKSRA